MFDLPDAKRVRRVDVREALESGWASSSDEEVDEELHAQIGRALGLGSDVLSPSKPPQDETHGDEALTPRPIRGQAGAQESQDEDLGEFEFRLFSTAGSKAKVVLKSEVEASGEGGIVARRPSSYYLVPKAPTELRRQYEFAALSGEDVLVRSRQRSWGLELPWKVTHVAMNAATTTARLPTAAEGSRSGGRRRPGKKTRITLRKKDRAEKLAAEAAKEKQLNKEEHLKDKKKRLNRAKKLRRRAKDKEKRVEAQGGHAEASDSDAST